MSEEVIDARQLVDGVFEEHLGVVQLGRDRVAADIAELGEDLAHALRSGGKLLVFGNGGSAADAQHFAAELVGRFSRPRPGLPAIALTTNTSALTAIANDFAFEDVFSRQVEALCRQPDIVVGISTSGNSENVVRGLAAAEARGARTWALTGANGGRVADAAGRCVCVPSESTARVQEVHITVIHAVSAIVDLLVGQ
jgi:D-sedoheptulose 7-phosphate isomerase